LLIQVNIYFSIEIFARTAQEKRRLSMGKVQRLSHSKWECIYHITWIPKYRKKKIYEELRAYLCDVFRELARQKDCEVLECHILADHVHISSHHLWWWYMTSFPSICQFGDQQDRYAVILQVLANFFPFITFSHIHFHIILPVKFTLFLLLTLPQHHVLKFVLTYNSILYTFLTKKRVLILLTFGTALTMIIVPVLYCTLFRIESPGKT
jgi:putative transposase